MTPETTTEQEELLIEEELPPGQGASALLSKVLRGNVQYAYLEGPWMTLMYENPKRMMKVNPTEGVVIEVPYYETAKH